MSSFRGRPFDVPTEVGQRVRFRAYSREGRVEWLKEKWCGVIWDDHYGPKICHIYELQKIEKKPA